MCVLPLPPPPANISVHAILVEIHPHPHSIQGWQTKLVFVSRHKLPSSSSSFSNAHWCGIVVSYWMWSRLSRSGHDRSIAVSGLCSNGWRCLCLCISQEHCRPIHSCRPLTCYYSPWQQPSQQSHQEWVLPSFRPVDTGAPWCWDQEEGARLCREWILACVPWLWWELHGAPSIVRSSTLCSGPRRRWRGSWWWVRKPNLTPMMPLAPLTTVLKLDWS
jgi:hypothetical protein